MIKSLFVKLSGVLVALSLFLGAPALLASQQVYAADAFQNGACQGANLDFSGAACDPKTNADTTKAAGTVNSMVATFITWFSFIVGVTAVIMIMIGGFRYITSGGDSNNVTAAKNTILYAIIGLVIVGLAQVIVRFVLHIVPK